MVLPRMAARALRDEPILVYGDGEQTRCFCHVDDTVEALLQLAQRIGAPAVCGRIFNVGNDHEVSMGELAERVRALSGGRSELRFVPYEEVYGPGFEDLRRRVPSVERLESATGFRPRIALETAIEDALAHARGALEAEGVSALDPSGSR